jgi:3-ketosteroid 9alpha-monooxygenase subunit B
MNERYHPLRVAEVIVETEDASSLVFELPEELAEEFRYRPGQFLTLRIPGGECDSVIRCYSLSSSPHTADPLKVTVKRTRSGYGSDWILRSVRAGSVLDVLPPAGHFTPESLEQDFLFLAAGSGITPVMSIVKSALVGGSGRVALIYANRDERSVIFAAELAGLVARYPDRCTVLHWLETLQGLPGATSLRALAEPFRDRDVFVCGPGPFMSGAVDALTLLGVPGERMHVEPFLSVRDKSFLDKHSAPSVAVPAVVRTMH